MSWIYIDHWRVGTQLNIFLTNKYSTHTIKDDDDDDDDLNCDWLIDINGISTYLGLFYA